jgi:multicomponent Na+:H+ antiporter subunit A
MGWLVLLHAALAAVAITRRRTLGNRAFLLGTIGPVAVVVWVLLFAPGVLDGDPLVEQISWVPSLDLDLAFRVDAYALVFLAVVGVAGTAIFPYAARYFPASDRVGTSAGVMTLFGGARIGLVASDHLLSLFLFWELTTITSYLLIGYDDGKAEARSAALHAALVTGAGGLAMLGGLVLLAREAGSFLISEIVAQPPAASAGVHLAWALVLLGAVTKSAQFPFHGWLAGAMAAPTPTSAFLHSATMVKAGIFLVGRLAPVAVATGWWSPTVTAIGFSTMILGGWRALRQHDLKLLLAFGTISQLGFMFLLVGSGDPDLRFGGIALLVAHALFKASLFMVVGTIDHEAKTRDLRRLDGLRKRMPALFWVGTAAAASMAALPLTFGFAAKEAAFDGLLGTGTWAVALAAAASILTVAYTGRFLRGAFGPHHEGHEPAGVDAHTPRNALLRSPLVLAGAGIALGLVPWILATPVKEATLAVADVATSGKLVLWPGLVPALGWSVVSLAIGSLFVWRPHPVERATGRIESLARRLPTTDGSFHRSVSGLISFADRSTGVLQNGSLPRYVGVIATVAVVLPSVAFLDGVPIGSFPDLGTPLELMIGTIVVAAAVAATLTKRRFAAVLMLGAVGYGIAGLYALIGGPDLALTQLLVETLAVALFALVLRYVPARFGPTRTSRAFRVTVAALVSVFVFTIGLVIAGSDPQPVSDLFVDRAVPEAQGRNIVNVILVDFRGFDTLGEITVIMTAALGTAALVAPVIRRTRRGDGA